jgi:uncharacterized protein
MKSRSNSPIEGATVTVRGEASMRADPDEALLVITLSEVEHSSGRALADVGRRTDALRGLLDEVGVATEDRSTSGVSVEEEFDTSSSGGRRLIGHRATAGVALRVTDSDTISLLITRSVEELRASINGPRWVVSPAHPVRLEAARLAAVDARRKAEAYASGVSAELGALVALVEPERPTAGASQLEVTAAIDATFELRPR